MKRVLISCIRTVVHILLWPLERLFGWASHKGATPPVFIIGAPRSGTSLLYELLVTRYKFAYISNLSHRFYLTPIAAAWLGKSRIAAWRGNFESRYGHIEGWGAPNEGGWVWLRWLKDGNWTDGKGFPENNAASLQKLTDGLSRLFNAPFINKNVMHSNRLLLMQRIWPNAIYIHVCRDLTDNVRSIVRAERKEGGPAHDSDHWWSVRPSIAHDFVGKSDVERAVAQVAGTELDIRRDLKAMGQGLAITIDYSDICGDPNKCLGDIAKLFAKQGRTLSDNHEVPAEFNPPASRPLSDADEALLQKTFAKLRQRFSSAS